MMHRTTPAVLFARTKNAISAVLCAVENAAILVLLHAAAAAQ